MAKSTKRSGAGAVVLGAALATVLAVPAVVAAAKPVESVGAFAGLEQPQPTLTRIVEVPYQTVVIEDDQLPMDVEVEEQAGAAGVEHFYSAPYSDVAGPVRSSTVVSAPVDRIVRVGTKVELPTATEPPEPEPEPEPAVEEANRGGGEASVPSSSLATTGQYGLADLQFQGVIYWGGNKFTYYSQSVLPGGGLAIPGRHVNGSGFVADGDGYIVLAAAPGISHGSVFSTPFGAAGKVYDTCATCSYEWLDVYTR